MKNPFQHIVLLLFSLGLSAPVWAGTDKCQNNKSAKCKKKQGHPDGHVKDAINDKIKKTDKKEDKKKLDPALKKKIDDFEDQLTAILDDYRAIDETQVDDMLKAYTDLISDPTNQSVQAFGQQLLKGITNPQQRSAVQAATASVQSFEKAYNADFKAITPAYNAILGAEAAEEAKYPWLKGWGGMRSSSYQFGKLSQYLHQNPNQKFSDDDFTEFFTPYWKSHHTYGNYVTAVTALQKAIIDNNALTSYLQQHYANNNSQMTSGDVKVLTQFLNLKETSEFLHSTEATYLTHTQFRDLTESGIALTGTGYDYARMGGGDIGRHGDTLDHQKVGAALRMMKNDAIAQAQKLDNLIENEVKQRAANYSDPAVQQAYLHAYGNEDPEGHLHVMVQPDYDRLIGAEKRVLGIVAGGPIDARSYHKLEKKYPALTRLAKKTFNMKKNEDGTWDFTMPDAAREKSINYQVHRFAKKVCLTDSACYADVSQVFKDGLGNKLNQLVTPVETIFPTPSHHHHSKDPFGWSVLRGALNFGGLIPIYTLVDEIADRRIGARAVTGSGDGTFGAFAGQFVGGLLTGGILDSIMPVGLIADEMFSGFDNIFDVADEAYTGLSESAMSEIADNLAAELPADPDALASHIENLNSKVSQQDTLADNYNKVIEKTNQHLQGQRDLTPEQRSNLEEAKAKATGGLKKVTDSKEIMTRVVNKAQANLDAMAEDGVLIKPRGPVALQSEADQTAYVEKLAKKAQDGDVLTDDERSYLGKLKRHLDEEQLRITDPDRQAIKPAGVSDDAAVINDLNDDVVIDDPMERSGRQNIRESYDIKNYRVDNAGLELDPAKYSNDPFSEAGQKYLSDFRTRVNELLVSRPDSLDENDIAKLENIRDRFNDFMVKRADVEKEKIVGFRNDQLASDKPFSPESRNYMENLKAKINAEIERIGDDDPAYRDQLKKMSDDLDEVTTTDNTRIKNKRLESLENLKNRSAQIDELQTKIKINTLKAGDSAKLSRFLLKTDDITDEEVLDLANMRQRAEAELADYPDSRPGDRAYEYRTRLKKIILDIDRLQVKAESQELDRIERYLDNLFTAKDGSMVSDDDLALLKVLKERFSVDPEEAEDVRDRLSNVETRLKEIDDRIQSAENKKSTYQSKKDISRKIKRAVIKNAEQHAGELRQERGALDREAVALRPEVEKIDRIQSLSDKIDLLEEKNRFQLVDAEQARLNSLLDKANKMDLLTDDEQRYVDSLRTRVERLKADSAKITGRDKPELMTKLQRLSDDIALVDHLDATNELDEEQQAVSELIAKTKRSDQLTDAQRQALRERQAEVRRVLSATRDDKEAFARIEQQRQQLNSEINKFEQDVAIFERRIDSYSDDKLAQYRQNFAARRAEIDDKVERMNNELTVRGRAAERYDQLKVLNDTISDALAEDHPRIDVTDNDHMTFLKSLEGKSPSEITPSQRDYLSRMDEMLASEIEDIEQMTRKTIDQGGARGLDESGAVKRYNAFYEEDKDSQPEFAKTFKERADAIRENRRLIDEKEKLRAQIAKLEGRNPERISPPTDLSDDEAHIDYLKHLQAKESSEITPEEKTYVSKLAKRIESLSEKIESHASLLKSYEDTLSSPVMEEDTAQVRSEIDQLKSTRQSKLDELKAIRSELGLNRRSLNIAEETLNRTNPSDGLAGDERAQVAQRLDALKEKRIKLNAEINRNTSDSSLARIKMDEAQKYLDNIDPENENKQSIVRDRRAEIKELRAKEVALKKERGVIDDQVRIQESKLNEKRAESPDKSVYSQSKTSANRHRFEIKLLREKMIDIMSDLSQLNDEIQFKENELAPTHGNKLREYSRINEKVAELREQLKTSPDDTALEMRIAEYTNLQNELDLDFADDDIAAIENKIKYNRADLNSYTQRLRSVESRLADAEIKLKSNPNEEDLNNQVSALKAAKERLATSRKEVSREYERLARQYKAATDKYERIESITKNHQMQMPTIKAKLADELASLKRNLSVWQSSAREFENTNSLDLANAIADGKHEVVPYYRDTAQATPDSLTVTPKQAREYLDSIMLTKPSALDRQEIDGFLKEYKDWLRVESDQLQQQYDEFESNQSGFESPSDHQSYLRDLKSRLDDKEALLKRIAAVERHLELVPENQPGQSVDSGVDVSGPADNDSIQSLSVDNESARPTTPEPVVSTANPLRSEFPEIRSILDRTTPLTRTERSELKNTQITLEKRLAEAKTKEDKTLGLSAGTRYPQLHYNKVIHKDKKKSSAQQIRNEIDDIEAFLNQINNRIARDKKAG